MRASSSASSSSRLLAGCAAGAGSVRVPAVAGPTRRARRVTGRLVGPHGRASTAPAPVHGRPGGAHDGQLGGGRDGRVADDAHGRLAELAGGRGDLGQGLGVGLRVRGPLGRQRAEGRRGRLAPAAAAARGVEEVLGGGAADGQSPVGGGPRRGLGHRGREGQCLLAGGRGIAAGGRGERGHRVDGLGRASSVARAPGGVGGPVGRGGCDGLMRRPARPAAEGDRAHRHPRRLHRSWPGAGLQRPRCRASVAGAPTRRRARRRVEADPNFSARNLPWATRASASARHTASKTLSIVAASRSSWSMRTISEDLPRSTGRLSANCRGSRR